MAKALPKISAALFELELPSTGKKILMRPFSTREEKILLIAQESKDITEAMLGIRQVVNNCLQEDLSVDDLATFDLEYVLINLRARSVDNMVQFSIKDPETDERVDLSLDIHNIKIERSPEHTNKIKVNDDYTIIMRYPTISEAEALMTMTSKSDMFDSMMSCLDKLVSDDEVYEFSEYTEEERNRFVDDLSGEVIKGIKKFFDTMPVLRHEIKYKNKNGDDKTFVIQGLETFFI